MIKITESLLFVFMNYITYTQSHNLIKDEWLYSLFVKKSRRQKLLSFHGNVETKVDFR